ncbi:hypothetical protein NDU88_006361 [Pleurodeles waltl]|uniref:Uncharacterized protein n=1 Tax=Pleurodeles waltl TaxID=8319 RepID=A0AAV7UPS4_PLEWA|nr:hypothetical protein NDU88_006361 [Pleurodeles waltl]
MDPRVRQALRLLEEAGRLDLLAEDGARRERPARQAASGVAAAVAACSPPRGRGCRSRRVPKDRFHPCFLTLTQSKRVEGRQARKEKKGDLFRQPSL